MKTTKIKTNAKTRMKKLSIKGKTLSGELKTIKAIDMTVKAKYAIEKFFWAGVGILGAIWVVYFMNDVIKNENPIMIRDNYTKLTDLDYPAITICSEITNKFGFAERIGNYFDSRQKLPTKLAKMRETFFDEVFSSSKDVRISCDPKMNHQFDKTNCEYIDKFYQYSQKEGKLMKDIYHSLKTFILSAPMADWNVKKLAYDFKNLTTANFVKNSIFDIKILDNITAEEYDNLDLIFSLYYQIHYYPELFDWSSKNIGTLFVKRSQLAPKFFDNHVNDLHDVFIENTSNVSFPDVAQMYNLKDFRVLLNHKLMTPGKYFTPEPDYYDLFSFMTSEPIRSSTFDNCIQEINRTQYFATPINMMEGEIPARGVHISPCLELKKYPNCTEYCSWHRQYFKTVDRARFLTMMKLAQPYRKVMDSSSENEKTVAKNLFGEDNIKDSEFHVTPMHLPIFCHRSDLGFFEESATFCEEFFQTPTDSGLCLTKNLDLKGIIHPNEELDSVFETELQSNQKIEKGTQQGRITLVLVLPISSPIPSGKADRLFKQSKETLKLHFHQNSDLGNMIEAGDVDVSTTPLTLETNKEYFVRVTPQGYKTSDSYKAMNIGKRKCRQLTEVSDDSLFRIYTKANCQYECKVTMASNLCKCTPWDFVLRKNFEECDIFGRTCFYNALVNITVDSLNTMCDHCISDCDYLSYKREILRNNKIAEKDQKDLYGRYLHCTYFTGNGKTSRTCKGIDQFVNYFFDKNNTMFDQGYLNMHDAVRGLYDSGPYNRAFNAYQDAIIIHINFFQPEIDLIDVKYSTLDKIANFGGKFGIFAQLTGCSLLGILNIVILLFKCLFTSPGTE